ncbi:MAG: thiol-disulfide oxidoreductase DCC family protein [Alphaproteobacteria bacterium]
MRERLTVYYNGACPICGAEVRHYRALAAKSEAPLDWVDISAEPRALERWGIDGEGAKRRLYAVEADGSLVGGVEAFARLWERLPRYRAFARVARTPGLRPFAEVLYERVLAPGLVRYNAWRERRRARAAA